MVKLEDAQTYCYMETFAYSWLANLLCAGLSSETTQSFVIMHTSRITNSDMFQCVNCFDPVLQTFKSTEVQRVKEKY